MKRGIFVLVEGVDGAGKTSVANYIKSKYDIEYHRGPVGSFEIASKFFNADKVTLNERFAFYAGENIRASMYINGVISTGKNIIVDRYFLSTIAYHTVSGNVINSEYFNIFKHLIQPDIVIIVQTDYVIIEERFKTRYVNDNDKFYMVKEKYETINRSFQHYTKRFNMKLIIANNDHKIEETFNLLEQKLNDLLK